MSCITGGTVTICDDTDLISINETINIIELEDTVEIVSVAEQGPTGPTGPAGPGGGTTIAFTTGESVSAYDPIRMASGLAYTADSDIVAHAGTVVGISLVAAITGASITVAAAGDVTFVGWSWSDGPVYVGSTGVLTQTPPTTGFSIMVGRASSSTSMVVEIQQAIILG